MNAFSAPHPEDCTLMGSSDALKENKPAAQIRRPLAERAIRWVYGVAAFGIAAVSLDVYVHEDQRKTYCSKMQKDFEATYMLPNSNSSIHTHREGIDWAKTVDVPKSEVRYLFPFHKESCYLFVPYKRYKL